MPYDMGNSLKELGESIRSAIVAKPKADLQVAQVRDELDKKQKKEDAKDKASEFVRSKFGETGEALYNAGESISSIASALRKKGGGGGGGGGGGRSPKDYFRKIKLAQQMTSELETRGEEALNQVNQARKNGDFDTLKSAIDRSNAIQNSLEEVKNFTMTFTTEGKKLLATDLIKKQDDLLSGMDQPKLGLVNETFMGALDNSNKIPSDVNKNMEDSRDEKTGIDLSKIPSNFDVEYYAITQAANKKIPTELARDLSRTTSIEDTKLFMEDDTQPMEIRMLAGARFKQLTSFSALFPDGKNMLENASDAKIAEIAFSNNEAKGVDRIKNETLQKEALKKFDSEDIMIKDSWIPFFDSIEGPNPDKKTRGNEKIKKAYKAINNYKSELEKIEKNAPNFRVGTEKRILTENLEDSINFLRKNNMLSPSQEQKSQRILIDIKKSKKEPGDT